MPSLLLLLLLVNRCDAAGARGGSNCVFQLSGANGMLLDGPENIARATDKNDFRTLPITISSLFLLSFFCCYNTSRSVPGSCWFVRCFVF